MPLGHWPQGHMPGAIKKHPRHPFIAPQSTAIARSGTDSHGCVADTLPLVCGPQT